MNKELTREEFLEFLKESYEYCNQVDDLGSIDFEMIRWQSWVNSWPQLATKEGGI